MEYSKLVLNPVRLRILQCMRVYGTVKPLQLIDYLQDVPRATVYHHVKILEDNGLIEVIETQQVRGAIEKTYSLAKGDAPDETTAELLLALHLDSLNAMTDYLDTPDHDFERDRVFFQVGLFHLSDEEYDRFLGDLSALIRTYAERTPTRDSRLRKLSFVSAPPLDDDHTPTADSTKRAVRSTTTSGRPS